MAPRKKPDATDTEPPEEVRPDTTATPLLFDDGKLLPPDVVFTAEKQLRWLEGLAHISTRKTRCMTMHGHTCRLARSKT